MRILLLNQFYPPDPAATGQLLQDVALGLVRAGHDVHVVCSAGAYSGGSAAAAAARHSGLHVHRVAATGFGRTTAAGRLADWGSYFALALGHGLRLGRFDACLALTTPPFIGLAGLALKRLRGTRLVLWTMDLWPDVAEASGALRLGGLLSRALRRAARAIYGGADTVISLGPTMTARLIAQGVPAGKVVTVHNWVPGEAVRPMPRGACRLPALRGTNGQFVAAYSGNMGQAHEFETILDAAQLLDDDPSVVFLFVGGGTRRGEVAEGASRRGLRNVRFAEPVPLGQLSELLAAGSVHLVSMRDGFEGMVVPSKTYGIMAAARPAIMVGSDRNEAARLLAESGAGFAVRTGDARRLADLIRQFRDNQSMAVTMGEAGRRHYEQHLGRDRSVRRIIRALTGQDNGPADREAEH